MSGHFDDERPVHDDACAYCGVLRDEPCSHFISRHCAEARCVNLQARPAEHEAAPAPKLIQIGPLDV